MSRSGSHKARNAHGEQNRRNAEIDAVKRLEKCATAEEIKAIAILLGELKPTKKFNREWATDVVMNMTEGRTSLALLIAAFGFDQFFDNPAKLLEIFNQNNKALAYMVPKRQPRKREAEQESPRNTAEEIRRTVLEMDLTISEEPENDEDAD